MKQTKTCLWDNLRFVLILSIVVGHFVVDHSDNSHLYKSLFLFIYSYHMPLLIFLTGRFHQNKDIARKIAACLGFTVALKIVVFLLQTAFGQGPTFSVLSESNFIWVFPAIAAFIGITWFLRDQDLIFVFVISLIIGIFSGYDTTIKDTLVLSRILVFYPFYLAGILTSGVNVCEYRKNRFLRGAAGVLILLWLILCFLKTKDLYILRPLFTGRNPFKENVLPYGALYRIECYLISSLLVVSWILLVPGRKLGHGTVMGRRCLQIYVWHRMILYVLTDLGIMDWLCTHRGPGKLLWLLISLGVLLLTSLKYFRQPTGWLAELPFRENE